VHDPDGDALSESTDQVGTGMTTLSNLEAPQLNGKTMVMSGGSRGIGLAIGKAAGRAGMNVVLLAKTSTPHPRLPGTVYTAAAEIERAGGRVEAVVGDVRDEDSVRGAVERALRRFGGIDVCINNASALSLQSTEDLQTKRFDLMTQIQLRGTFLLTRACLSALRVSTNPHVLTISPPLNLSPRWLGAHPPYTMSKYAMTLLAMGWAWEQRDWGIASNTLWPQTLIATAAVSNVLGGTFESGARSPEIMADAALLILQRPARECTGNTFIDADVLMAAGVNDIARYGGGRDTLLDLFVDPQ
jgi:citronellol/citronellal dehydrogenase